VLATASDDYTVRFWDAVSGQPLAPLLQQALNVRHVVFSPDGRRLLTACWDKTARLWDVSPTDWPEEDVAQFAAFESAARRGAGTALQPLDGGAINAGLKAFSGRHPELFGQSASAPIPAAP
jgi:hypothetical protein